MSLHMHAHAKPFPHHGGGILWPYKLVGWQVCRPDGIKCIGRFVGVQTIWEDIESSLCMKPLRLVSLLYFLKSDMIYIQAPPRKWQNWLPEKWQKSHGPCDASFTFLWELKMSLHLFKRSVGGKVLFMWKRSSSKHTSHATDNLGPPSWALYGQTIFASDSCLELRNSWEIVIPKKRNIKPQNCSRWTLLAVSSEVLVTPPTRRSLIHCS